MEPYDTSGTLAKILESQFFGRSQVEGMLFEKQ
jgi:hypothetical protein